MMIYHMTESCPHCHDDTGYTIPYLIRNPDTKCPNCNKEILGEVKK